MSSGKTYMDDVPSKYQYHSLYFTFIWPSELLHTFLPPAVKKYSPEIIL